MQHSEFGLVRKFWRVPQSMSAAVSIGAGVHNISVTH
jgi:hypothetical protein